jgi:phospholipase/carboxylesterase
MSELQTPIVEWRLAQSPEAALTVLLQGWGEDDVDMLERSRDLPSTLSYASLQAPYRHGRNFAWFDAGKSLEATCGWLKAWLDQVAPERPILLVGFSAGAAFAAGAMPLHPGRYLGVAMLCGTMPSTQTFPYSRAASSTWTCSLPTSSMTG